MIEADDRYAVPPACAIHWQRSIEVDAAVVKRPCNRNGIGANRSDHIRPGRKILGPESPQGTEGQYHYESEPDEIAHFRFGISNQGTISQIYQYVTPVKMSAVGNDS